VRLQVANLANKETKKKQSSITVGAIKPSSREGIARWGGRVGLTG